MTITQIKTELHNRIEHLSEAQIEKLQELIDKTFPKESDEADLPQKRRLVGSMKGLVTYMADDFNEPLDEFKDYMPE